MKYTRVHEHKGRKTWVFNPPKEAREAGVVHYKVFNDGRVARYEIPRLIQLVERYRRGAIKEANLTDDSRFVHLCNNYFNSAEYNSLSLKSQKMYTQALGRLCEVELRGKPFGQYKAKGVDLDLCRELYQYLVQKEAAVSANRKIGIVGIVLTHGVKIGFLSFNPVVGVEKVQYKRETTVWTQEQVEAFLEEGYKTFRTRNTTLIAHMCYEWAQIQRDITHLTWDNLDFESNTVTIHRAVSDTTVQLPIEEPLLSLLKEQEKDWGFQEYVVPNTVPSGSIYKPMNYQRMRKLCREVLKEADLPLDLSINQLRGTAITEMIQAGADTIAIKQVTGHGKISSLTPYIKNTREGALKALTKRRNK